MIIPAAEGSFGFAQDMDIVVGNVGKARKIRGKAGKT
jgi:hypothetical protein